MRDSTKFPHNEIYEELLFGLTDAGWKNKWSVEGERIVVQTESVQTLKQHLGHNGPMDYHVAERMVMDLGAQMAALAGIRKGIMFFSLDDIIVLGNQTFMIANLDNIVSLNNESSLVLDRPAKLEGFLPPELENVRNSAFYHQHIVSILQRFAHVHSLHGNRQKFRPNIQEQTLLLSGTLSRDRPRQGDSFCSFNFSP